MLKLVLRPRLLPATLAALLLVGVGACRTGPTDKERKIAEGRKDLGTDHLSNGRHREALKELLAAEELNPEDPELHYTMALVYVFGFQRYDDARGHLEKAMDRRENYSEAMNLYGITLVEQERYAEAIPYFEKAMDNLLYETPQFAQQNLGWAMYKSGRVEQGIEQLETAVRSAPDLCGAYHWLGVAHGEQGRLADAVKWWEGYRERCDGTRLSVFVPPTQRAEVQYRLGMAYVKLGDVERAREAFQNCVDRFGRLPVAEECGKSMAVLP